MTTKTKIIISALSISMLGSFFAWLDGHNLFVIAVPSLIALFLLYALWNPPKRHRLFSYKDQQRAIRAFDRSEQIDMGKPDWAKDKHER